MEIPREEKYRSYIKDRIPRLRRQISHAHGAAIAGLTLSLGALAMREIGLIKFSLFLILIYAGHGLICSILNLHIDSLAFYHRDLDRDKALGLEGFETTL